MRAPALLRLALAGTALVASAGLAAADTGAPTAVDEKLFFRNTGTTCSPGNPFLAEAPGTGDINCGYIGGGLPFGEAFEAAGQSNERVFSTVLPDVEPEDLPTFRLDDAKALAGKIVVQAGSQQGQALPGTGQIVVELDVVGQTADGETVALGSGTNTVTATPPARTVEVPFTFDLADSVGDADLVGITATLTTRGLHVFHGFAQMNTSTLTLPVVREAAQPAATEE